MQNLPRPDLANDVHLEYFLVPHSNLEHTLFRLAISNLSKLINTSMNFNNRI